MNTRRKTKVTRGYTVVEVMVALGVLTVGAAGVISLQRSAVVAGLNSRQLMTASNVGAGWIEQLQASAAAWNTRDNSDIAIDLAGTTLGDALQPPFDWVKPGVPGSSSEGINIAPPAPNMFCTHVRGNFLGLANGDEATDTVKIEVRVIWDKSGRDIGGDCAAWSAADVTTAFATDAGVFPNGQPRDNFGLVMLTGAVRRNTTQ